MTLLWILRGVQSSLYELGAFKAIIENLSSALGNSASSAFSTSSTTSGNIFAFGRLLHQFLSRNMFEGRPT